MELDFVNWLAATLPRCPELPLGLSDDAAIMVPPEGRQLVVTTDMLSDGVHFELSEHSPERIGRKSLAASLSDLAAMAAEPLAAFVSINVPRQVEADELARQLYAGMLPLTSQFECPIAGGDTNCTAGPLVISVTAIGTVTPGNAWRRSGATAGDRILVTGSLGGSLCGHHLDFTPRVAEALQLAKSYDIHAAMDISDGLALDLSRMATASGVGAVVDVARVPVSQAAHDIAKSSDKTALHHALGDGEDFELLLAVPKDVAEKLISTQPLPCPLTDVGEFTQEQGLRQQTVDARIEPLTPTGYSHG